jgi:hypothetical protein
VVTLAAGAGWPTLELLVFWARFGQLPPGGAADALVFAPMGLASGLILAALLAGSSSARQRRFALSGYLLACPLAFLASLVSGLLLPNVWGPLLFGVPVLAAFSAVGYRLGRPHTDDGRAGTST